MCTRLSPLYRAAWFIFSSAPQIGGSLGEDTWRLARLMKAGEFLLSLTLSYSKEEREKERGGRERRREKEETITCATVSTRGDGTTFFLEAFVRVQARVYIVDVSRRRAKKPPRSDLR